CEKPESANQKGRNSRARVDWRRTPKSAIRNAGFMMASTKRDYYEVLEIDRGADSETITKAYRKLAMKFHPDRNVGDGSAEDKFKEAAEAYDVLRDPEKKARYDRYGHAGLDGFAPGGHHFTDARSVFDVFGDLFGDLFGGGGRGAVITDPCPTCHGDGRVTIRRTLEVAIPPGVDTGMRVRLNGEGEAGDPGGPRGDLFVVVRVHDHPLFARDGTNLVCQV